VSELYETFEKDHQCMANNGYSVIDRVATFMILCFVSKSVCLENGESSNPKNESLIEKSLIIAKSDCISKKLAGEFFTLENADVKSIVYKFFDFDDNLL
jgi:hypothetical protein